MDNSNFGCDCRNSLDNCQFSPIFDELGDITYINHYHNIFDEKVSAFVTTDLVKQTLRKNLMKNLLNSIKKINFIK